MNPNEEKDLKNTFNHIMNDDLERTSLWGYPMQEADSIRTDDELEKSIRELLRHSTRADASDVSLEVDHGDVRLSGTVKTQGDRDYLINVVKLVRGVGLVNSDLIVKTHEGILPSDIGRH